MDVTTTCQVTYSGAEISLPETGITLTIPRRAILKGNSVKISLSLSLDEDYPDLDEGHTLICPIVKCQPSGTHFVKPLTLTLPCNAGNDRVHDEHGVTIWTKRVAGENIN